MEHLQSNALLCFQNAHIAGNEYLASVTAIAVRTETSATTANFLPLMAHNQSQDSQDIEQATTAILPSP